MIQVTAQYESPSTLRHEKCTSTVMHAIHITLLPTGPFDIEPLCITLPRPVTQVSYDICKEIKNLLGNYRSELKATYANPKQYWMMRENQNNKMKVDLNLNYIILFNKEILRRLITDSYKWIREDMVA